MRDFKGMKRQRGRNRSGSGPQGGGKPQQNANRAFDSSGPENVKVRGHAQSVYEKYQQLARDAFSSGDRVLAEGYLQHAEHYFRLLRLIQPNRPTAEIVARDVFASGFDIDFEDESGSQAGLDGDPPPPEATGETAEAGTEPREEGEPPRARYEDRGGRNQNERQQNDRYQGDRSDRVYGERSGGDRNQSDRGQGERGQNERYQADRYQGDRQNGRGQNDRTQNDRGQNDRGQGDRYASERGQADRAQSDRFQGDRDRVQGERQQGERDRGERDRGDRARGEGRRDGRNRGEAPGSAADSGGAEPLDRSDRASEPRAEGDRGQADRGQADRSRGERTRGERGDRNRERYEPVERGDGAYGDAPAPAASSEPATVLATIEPSAGRSPQLRSEDGGFSEAPAFLQAATPVPTAAPSDEEGEPPPARRPRAPRVRRRPGDAEVGTEESEGEAGAGLQSASEPEAV